MFSILLINHSYHSIPVFVSLIMTLWQPNGRLLSTVKEFYKILERAQRQTCYHARGLLVPEIPRERGRQPAEESRGRDESLYFPYAEESCRYVIEQLSRRWSPARPLFMNIFHEIFSSSNVSRLSIIGRARSRITVVSSQPRSVSLYRRHSLRR